MFRVGEDIRSKKRVRKGCFAHVSFCIPEFPERQTSLVELHLHLQDLVYAELHDITSFDAADGQPTLPPLLMQNPQVQASMALLANDTCSVHYPSTTHVVQVSFLCRRMVWVGFGVGVGWVLSRHKGGHDQSGFGVPQKIM